MSGLPSPSPSPPPPSTTITTRTTTTSTSAGVGAAAVCHSPPHETHSPTLVQPFSPLFSPLSSSTRRHCSYHTATGLRVSVERRAAEQRGSGTKRGQSSQENEKEEEEDRSTTGTSGTLLSARGTSLPSSSTQMLVSGSPTSRADQVAQASMIDVEAPGALSTTSGSVAKQKHDPPPREEEEQQREPPKQREGGRPTGKTARAGLAIHLDPPSPPDGTTAEETASVSPSPSPGSMPNLVLQPFPPSPSASAAGHEGTEHASLPRLRSSLRGSEGAFTAISAAIAEVSESQLPPARGKPAAFQRSAVTVDALPTSDTVTPGTNTLVELHQSVGSSPHHISSASPHPVTTSTTATSRRTSIPSVLRISRSKHVVAKRKPRGETVGHHAKNGEEGETERNTSNNNNNNRRKKKMEIEQSETQQQQQEEKTRRKEERRIQHLCKQLYKEKLYCAMNCFCRIRRKDKIWSCRKCGQIFHLECVQRWAKNDVETPGLRCPQCREEHPYPKRYTCFCGKVRDPPALRKKSLDNDGQEEEGGAGVFDDTSKKSSQNEAFSSSPTSAVATGAAEAAASSSRSGEAELSVNSGKRMHDGLSPIREKTPKTQSKNKKRREATPECLPRVPPSTAPSRFVRSQRLGELECGEESGVGGERGDGEENEDRTRVHHHYPERAPVALTIRSTTTTASLPIADAEAEAEPERGADAVALSSNGSSLPRRVRPPAPPPPPPQRQRRRRPLPTASETNVEAGERKEEQKEEEGDGNHHHHTHHHSDNNNSTTAAAATPAASVTLRPGTSPVPASSSSSSHHHERRRHPHPHPPLPRSQVAPDGLETRRQPHPGQDGLSDDDSTASPPLTLEVATGAEKQSRTRKSRRKREEDRPDAEGDDHRNHPQERQELYTGTTGTTSLRRDMGNNEERVETTDSKRKSKAKKEEETALPTPAATSDERKEGKEQHKKEKEEEEDEVVNPMAPHCCGHWCGKTRGFCDHPCPLRCHPGPCPPCTVEPIRAVLSCFCGKTTTAHMSLPLPCGMPPPTCSEACSIPRRCGHPYGRKHHHTCHFGKCPPCGFCKAERKLQKMKRRFLIRRRQMREMGHAWKEICLYNDPPFTLQWFCYYLVNDLLEVSERVETWKEAVNYMKQKDLMKELLRFQPLKKRLKTDIVSFLERLMIRCFCSDMKRVSKPVVIIGKWVISVMNLMDANTELQDLYDEDMEKTRAEDEDEEGDEQGEEEDEHRHSHSSRSHENENRGEEEEEEGNGNRSKRSSTSSS